MVCGPLTRYGCSKGHKQTTSEQTATAKGMGKKMNALIFLKVSLFVRGLLSLSVRNGYCEVASYSLDAA